MASEIDSRSMMDGLMEFFVKNEGEIIAIYESGILSLTGHWISCPQIPGQSSGFSHIALHLSLLFSSPIYIFVSTLANDG